MTDSNESQGRFWIGAGGEAPMYVEWAGPPEPDTGDRPPLILIHGGGGQGLDWLGTPDGRPGWAPELAHRGHRVYTVDRPGHGRGAQWAGALGEMGAPPTAEGLGVLFRSPDGVHPTAHLQTQWPGDRDGAPGSDPAILHMVASCRSMPTDLSAAHTLERQLGAELIDRVGPSVLFTHSAGGPAGWLIAAARPELVRAIVALEPFGPPFRPAADGLPGLPHGLTAVPLDGTLSGIPVLLVTAEASILGHFDTEVRDYLTDAGAQVELLRLADHGIRGNGHGMIFERNHLQVLDLVMDELGRLLAH
ncbi:MAG TPA: alpha/beta fold hydrolase [Solirubrobacteraceae bacterium]|jgi:pimeloyl-ACP methyl ester carboxylesterase|nr:alpha/beta fold hydrolase [Solirubrobacteraceae bacterium]